MRNLKTVFNFINLSRGILGSHETSSSTMSRDVLITGSAGFIGFHLARRLVRRPDLQVVGVDSFDPYYDPQLKRDRLRRLDDPERFRFEELDLADTAAVRDLFDRHDFDAVVHLAARPGARASSEQPDVTVRNNVDGFLSVLEACRHGGVDHLVFASSSSVYGRYRAEPLSEHQPVQHPVSLYAATKVSNEAMAHSYAHLYGIPTTGLRFFTVYGPWGRPDMAYYLFAEAIAEGNTIDLYNQGEMRRDFTYVGDIVDGIERTLEQPPSGNDDWNPMAPDPATSPAPYRLFNLGSGDPIDLKTFVRTIEEAMGRTADKRLVSMPPADVESTHADAADFRDAFDYRPTTDLEEGIGRFVEWYHAYHAETAPPVEVGGG